MIWMTIAQPYTINLYVRYIMKRLRGVPREDADHHGEHVQIYHYIYTIIYIERYLASCIIYIYIYIYHYICISTRMVLSTANWG